MHRSCCTSSAGMKSIAACSHLRVSLLRLSGSRDSRWLALCCLGHDAFGGTSSATAIACVRTLLLGKDL